MLVKLIACSSTDCFPYPPAPTLDGSDLEYVENYKYLGVWLDCKLSFQTHIKHLQSKIKSRIGFLFRNKASFIHAAKHTLVKLTILPILDFGNVIYKIAPYIQFAITVPSVLSPKPHITSINVTCMLLLAGPHYTVGQKVFSQPPIVQLLPLKKMREACNFHL